MRRILLAATAAIALALPASAQQKEFPSTLLGHAILPAFSMIAPPVDAPSGFAVSGKFTGPGNTRTDRPGTLVQPTGIGLPLVGQPLQGFSGIKPVGDGSYWVLTDNGFGSKRNSPDALLFFSRVSPNWATGRVEPLEHIFLTDPDRKVPFQIHTEATRERYLTGADFDPESIQPVSDGFWIGDEFGPFLVHVDLQGRVTGVYPTISQGSELRSPDNPAFQVPASPTEAVSFRARRSGGYEGMALSPDGRMLYALLEQPLWNAQGQPETEGGKRFLRILEFSTTSRSWTGRQTKFALEDGATAIGDFNMVDSTRALIIERDNGEGDPSMACAQGTTPSAENRCFANPARFKRIVLVDLFATDEAGFVKKIGYIDLMNMRDPDSRARQKGEAKRDLAGFLTFPFFTIENVAMVDPQTIIVANDNNFPFSIGRFTDRAADNEFVLLRVPEFLAAK